jgi:hypothetical protein
MPRVIRRRQHQRPVDGRVRRVPPRVPLAARIVPCLLHLGEPLPEVRDLPLEELDGERITEREARAPSPLGASCPSLPVPRRCASVPFSSGPSFEGGS